MCVFCACFVRFVRAVRVARVVLFVSLVFLLSALCVLYVLCVLRGLNVIEWSWLRPPWGALNNRSITTCTLKRSRRESFKNDIAILSSSFLLYLSASAFWALGFEV